MYRLEELNSCLMLVFVCLFFMFLFCLFLAKPQKSRVKDLDNRTF